MLPNFGYLKNPQVECESYYGDIKLFPGFLCVRGKVRFGKMIAQGKNIFGRQVNNRVHSLISDTCTGEACLNFQYSKKTLLFET